MPIIWSTESAWSFIYWFFFQFESAIDSYLTISVQIKIHCVIRTVLMYFHSSVLWLPQASKNRLLERMNLLFRHHCTQKENSFNSSGNNCEYSGNKIRKTSHKPFTKWQLSRVSGCKFICSLKIRNPWDGMETTAEHQRDYIFPVLWSPSVLGDWKSNLFKKQNLTLYKLPTTANPRTHPSVLSEDASPCIKHYPLSHHSVKES